MRFGHVVGSFMMALALSSMGCVASEESDGEDVGLSQDALEQGHARAADFHDVPDLTNEERKAILARYAHVQHDGVRTELYENAILYYDTNRAVIPNGRYLSVLDFAKHSKYRRFYILDMEGGDVQSYVVAHGKNSDPDWTGNAQYFSNVSGSNKSSVGYYLTAETYYGAHGRSLRLDGLSATNSNVRERAIVIHGADYVVDGQDKQGRSLGCPALPNDAVQRVIDKIAAGSVIYAWN